MATVDIEHPAEGITRIVLTRPERLNAINFELVAELHRLWTRSRSISLQGRGADRRGPCLLQRTGPQGLGPAARRGRASSPRGGLDGPVLHVVSHGRT